MPAAAKTDRDAILGAALQRVRQDGLAALSWRALAADVGIAPNALYHHFPTRAHLENALSEEAARRMHLALGRETAKAAKPTAAVSTGAAARQLAVDRIRALSTAYLRFAQREPHLYAAMLSGPCGTDEPNPEHTGLWDLVCDAAAALHGKENASDAAMSLWALLHGTVSLKQSGALAATKPADCLRFSLSAWLNAA